ncbi:MAG: M23 family metallopeptidase [Polyangiales bacterium]
MGPALLRTTFALLTCSLLLGADWPKWNPRRRQGEVPQRYAAALLDPASWAPEPVQPKNVDVARFGRAIRAVCPNLTAQRAEQFARWIDGSARTHGEDPFLIAALMSRASHCKGNSEEMQGIGLTGIQPEMYRGNVEGDMLRYAVLEGEDWTVHAKLLSRALTVQALENPESNIEWTAALLAMWREQHDAIDEQFEQAGHRHYVSHFLWGDRVQSARAEDGVFTERRRLLSHYAGTPTPVATREFRSIEFSAPLEGSPRIVSSKPGADRDRGLRMHRGVDVDAAMGEPVLAMADGRVSFAGVDLPGRGTAIDLAPETIHRVQPRDMGAGGRYVCITHAPNPVSPPPQNLTSSYAPDSLVTTVPRESDVLRAPDEETEDVDTASTTQTQQRRATEIKPAEIAVRDPASELVSCYMHLNSTRVRSGQVVKRGQQIGTVGRTGCKESPAHLHLELKSSRQLFDARDVLSGILIGDPPWRSAKEERRARKRARAENLTSHAFSKQNAKKQQHVD